MIDNKTIAARAREIASRSFGCARRAANVVYVAAATTGTVASARKALELVGDLTVRRVAGALLAELAEEADSAALS